MSHSGVKFTQLFNIGNGLAGNSVMAIVNIPGDETMKVRVDQLGNYILANIAPNTNSNLGPIGNVTILGGSNGNVLATYGNGHLYWTNNFPPGGPNNSVQFQSNGVFAGSNAFIFDSSTETLTVTEIAIENLSVANTTGTSEQVLGIIDQATQQVGWKTLPTNYIEVGLRNGSSYTSSITVVLRKYPVKLRDGSFIEVETVN